MPSAAYCGNLLLLAHRDRSPASPAACAVLRMVAARRRFSFTACSAFCCLETLLEAEISPLSIDVFPIGKSPARFMRPVLPAAVLAPSRPEGRVTQPHRPNREGAPARYQAAAVRLSFSPRSGCPSPARLIATVPYFGRRRPVMGLVRGLGLPRAPARCVPLSNG